MVFNYLATSFKNLTSLCNQSLELFNFKLNIQTYATVGLDIHLDRWPLRIMTFQEEQKTGWSFQFLVNNDIYKMKILVILR